MCALVSRRIAEKIAYLSPDEAYLTGLLHDIGKLILWINFPEEHADILTSSQHRQGLNAAGEARHEAAHYDIGAWLIKRWNLRSFMADAVLYHHEPLERVRNALPLVKIIYVGNALCSETNNDQAAAYKTAKNILGLEMSAAEEIIRQAEEEVDKISESLGIEFEPEEGSNQAVSKNDRQNREDLLKEVRNITLLQSTLQNLLEARDEDSILEAVQQGIGILFDVKTVVFFLYEPERNILQGKSVSSDQQHDLINKVTIPFQKEKSILATSLIQGNPLGSSRDSIKDNPTIIDEQIIRLVDKDGILCLPMAASQHYVGVIVLGLKEDRFSNLAEELRLLALFSKQAAKALHENYLRQSRANQLRADHPGAVSNLVRKVAHEVNTPLSIIKNYLAVLKSKLAEDRSFHEEIRIINEEVDSVALIVRELSDSVPLKTRTNGPSDLNALLEDLIKILQESHMLGLNINTQLKLDPSLPPVMADKNRMKQVFNNLIMNAAEAMPHGGNLEISTRYVIDYFDVNLDSNDDRALGHAEITIKDDGPGIVDTVKSKLFEPYVTTKGHGHEGLGLSIVHSNVIELNGTLTCESENNKGTRFKLVFPIIHNEFS
jgi:signal transduction histidine kinase